MLNPMMRHLKYLLNLLYLMNNSFNFLVVSKCKTRIGNQLSSFAATLYFQQTYKVTAVMDSFQMSIIKSIFDTSDSTVTTLDISKCCLPTHWKRWNRVKPFEINPSTQVATRIKQNFVENIGLYQRNHLINLGAHTMPVFLYKNIIKTVKRELKFKRRILKTASRFFKSVPTYNKGRVKNKISV